MGMTFRPRSICWRLYSCCRSSVPALIILINNNVVAVKDRPRLVPGNLHAVVLVVAGPAQIANRTAAHIVRHNTFKPTVSQALLNAFANDLPACRRGEIQKGSPAAVWQVA